ncbi:hypothetical protein GQR58_017080 [Nymphon striatum]|nr:hypothetical protein GQR58_017080 [Nymphon striatum]
MFDIFKIHSCRSFTITIKYAMLIISAYIYTNPLSACSILQQACSNKMNGKPCMLFIIDESLQDLSGNPDFYLFSISLPTYPNFLGLDSGNKGIFFFGLTLIRMFTSWILPCFFLLQATPEELKDIATHIDDYDYFNATGIRLGGQKFVRLNHEENVLKGKKNQDGLICFKCLT